MSRKVFRKPMLASSVVALVALVAMGFAGGAWPAAVVQADGLATAAAARAMLGPSGSGAAQVTPATAAPSPTTAAATATATATTAATATATGAVSPTASPVATSAAGVGAAAAATATASPAVTAAATGTATSAATPTTPPTPTAPPTPTVPVATSTAVMVVTPITVPTQAAALDTYMTSVAPQLRYYNGPNAQYPLEWYLQRHLGNPAQFTMYRTEPVGLCNTYYYQYQGVYYCYTAGAAAAMPDVLVPGMGVVPPTVLMPGAVPPSMGVGVVPGVMGGVVQTPSGYAVQSAWANVAPQQQYYYGPEYQYDYDWYAQRHLSHPSLYRVYSFDPGGACGTYYYRWQDRYYCYTGGSIGPTAAMMMPGPDVSGVDPTTWYALQSYWGNVDPSYQYYYGPDYAYDDAWYAQRHVNNPLLYRAYDFDPADQCASYYYRYQDRYYCYTGLYNYSTGTAEWTVPVRYWAQVDPQYRYYYGPDYSYDDVWYQQRHLTYPWLYQPYDFDPGGACGTYYYRYQSSYYCYVGD